MSVGTWISAEYECAKHGSHLWSINSHSEWWNILHTVGTVNGKIYKTQLMGLLTTSLIFIGLSNHQQVSDIHCTHSYPKNTELSFIIYYILSFASTKY